ncbi:alpha/beta fold hydrolase [Mesorhizobium sp. CO1-1-4]|uniref:alpha/beta fold hydrolase n=1 Tax=Mesorhizobium sp. CO1-1-4 TaxID=2876633 RepID=UPI001CCFAFC0|nr:alpha/beta hydrolase [Mesorhizobium sp. CO1-1-4]MBZ9738683.1 alpha/beta hydrolase [Mesorhizobium sp. CO1-1-4]
MTNGHDATLQPSQTFDFHGQKVRWGVVGEGPPLVLVHGTPFSSAVWRKIIPYFCDHRRVYFYDLLGYGQSEMRDGQDVSLGIQNKVLEALLEHWELDNPDVVGHDFGGATVLRAHLLGKRNYRSMTLIDPVAVAPWGTPLIRHARQHEAVFAGLPAYVHEAIVPAYIAGSAHQTLPAATMALYAAPWFGEQGQAAFYRQVAQMDERYTDEVEPRYAEIRCPILILWGELDRWISVEHGRTLARKIPGSTLKIIPGAGHIVQEDAPEAVVAALLKFLP